jgi:EsV-1-7 cysteine-rich motif
MELQKCGSCIRKPQPLDQFLDKFGRPCSTCLKCRIHTKRNRKPCPPVRPCEVCQKTSSFNFPGKTPGIRCVDHKELGMVNVVQKNCEHEGCTKQPCYNLPTEHFGKFCATHKTKDMVNVRERRCEYDGCIKKPFYNLPSETKGRFCKEHKGEGMVDVLSNSCIHEECNKRATFNHPGKEAKFCGTHKEDGMVDVKTRRCEYEGCMTVPVFNLPGKKRGRFCLKHKEPGMEDVKNKRCKTHMCDIILAGSSKDYCARCTAYMFPDQPSYFKTREMKLKEYLQATYQDKTIIHDKHVECHRYRPDFVFDMGSHTVVIEIDENQHKSYDTSCDNKRLMSIFHGLGSRPMVMVRFNPDRYDSVQGCFKRDGQLTGNGQEWKKRTGQLKTRIDHWLDTEPDREITVEHLFFDTDR